MVPVTTDNYDVKSTVPMTTGKYGVKSTVPVTTDNYDVSQQCRWKLEIMTQGNGAGDN